MSTSVPGVPRDGQNIRGQSLPVRLANFVKLPHTVFAMPFALVGVAFGSTVHAVTGRMILWVACAFTCARFAAMGFNRIVDRDVDAINPRTSMRELPSGVLTLAQAKLAVTIASLGFVMASWQLNTLCLFLSPIALAWVFGYSYTKRFTRWSHLWLGLGLSIAPVGGFLAVTGAWSTPWWLIGTLALAVVTWSGGFDMLYALQDVAFDREQGLHSMPSAIGIPRTIALARLLHVAAVACLATVVLANPLHAAGMNWIVQTPLYLGVGLVAVLLVWEHRLVRAHDLSRLNAAFFTMNGIISLTFLAFVLLATVLRNMHSSFPTTATL